MAPTMEPTGQEPRTGQSPELALPVAEVSERIAGWISKLGSVWIEGELTSWNIRGGHAYAKLKDLRADATLSVTVWRTVLGRVDGEFQQGDRVILCAKPDFWVRGGTLSMQASDLRHVGLGQLLEQLERLRRQLAAEGLFDPSRKKPLPFLPNRIGLITGKDSDAEKDVRRNAELRWPAVSFRTIHTSVQGVRTVDEVSAALRELDADPEVDVIIVARGGGDFQHLLPFSDEALVRLAASLETPIVSAIGHENDRPILDEVADLRASTPTDAAKRVVPDVAEQLAGVRDARNRIFQRVATLISHESHKLEQLRSRPVLSRPEVLVDREADEIGRLATRGEELALRRTDRAGDELERLRAQLRALSPQATLDRGYAIAEVVRRLPDRHLMGGQHETELLRRGEQAPAGTTIDIRLAAGTVRAVSSGRFFDGDVVAAAERIEGDRRWPEGSALPEGSAAPASGELEMSEEQGE